MDVTEQSPFVGLPERGTRRQLGRPSDVVEHGGGEQQVRTEPWMQLCGLPADGRHAHGVLEQPAGVGVVRL
jgi:hypothetical protein